MSLACGIDVGGTKIAGGVVDEDGTILEQVRLESPATDAEAMEEAIAGVVRDLRSRHPIEAVGIGAAGYISRNRSTVLFSPNLAWRDVDLGRDVQARIDLPVVVENDALAAAWGEFRFGAGHDVDDFLLVTVGTGVGGGLVLADRPYRGAFGVAAEIGHMRVVPQGIECGCGKRGCLEQYASGSALERSVLAAVEAQEPGTGPLLGRAGGDPLEVSGPMVTELAQQGDPFCVAALAEIGSWLGEGIASIAEVLDPRVVAIGGGVSEAGDLLLGPAREGFHRELVEERHDPGLDLRPAQLGNDAGLLGAADLARQP